MEHTPPPFFKRGPAPLVRLAFFASLSVALLVLDARFRYADGLRQALMLAAQPLQEFAALPGELAGRIAGYFSSQTQLQDENAALRRQLVEASLSVQRLQAALAGSEQLRRLAGAAERRGDRGTAAEILYSARDPYARRVIIDRGTQHGVRAGSPVVDEIGVIGQVTRTHSGASEVTLLVDKDQAIPVQVARNGLRAVAFGSGVSGMLELRFMAANAEIEAGDRLVTSGLDGVYPPGLAVASVTRIERDAANSFARILCQPAAGVERGRFVLVLSAEARAAPYPEEATTGSERDARTGKVRRARKKAADGA
ncbi:MAG: rod shape-determining protein MreC [Betaproteobacteria bacterium RIFCSPLOWO2_02_67_12]|nr:MAG: rod shape-determining protein MreC [Betaproteobacteria bacterium RIFCSPLOWO2_02_67_12]